MASSKPASRSTDFVKDSRFNQTFTLPADANHPQDFTVTYSDFGFHHPDGPQHDNVVLFCGPLFSSRFVPVTKDNVAKKHHLRIITFDRPGFGGTTPVTDVADRVRSWLRIVPALLEHLGIKQISIVSQSAGTVYALNTLLYLPHLLHPERPYAALCVPWVHPSHSGAGLMSLTHKLPAAAINTVDTLAGFVNTTLQPIVGFSGGVSDFMMGSIGASKTKHIAEGVDPDDVAFEETLQPDIAKHAFGLGSKGMGQEALMLLKRDGKEDVWGPWLDTDTFVPLLASRMAAGAEESESSGGKSSQKQQQKARLKVEVFYSEADVMIGTDAGPKFFDDCWRAEQRGDSIGYSSTTIHGTDHDSIMNIRFGVVNKIFETISTRNTISQSPTQINTNNNRAPGSARRSEI